MATLRETEGGNEALATDTRRGEILVERRTYDEGIAEHWRRDDGEHVVRFTLAGNGTTRTHHVPGEQAGDPFGWFEGQLH